MSTTLRAFTLYPTQTVEDPNWWEVGEGNITNACFCEFGPAEEVIGLLYLQDGTFVVGVGESLRPYDERYRGKSQEEASEVFLREVNRHVKM